MSIAPAGVMACEPRVFLCATAPPDPEDHDFAAVGTQTPQL